MRTLAFSLCFIAVFLALGQATLEQRPMGPDDGSGGCPFMANMLGQTSDDAKFRQLEHYTRDDAHSEETTQFGQKINNTDSLKAGLRGPTLLEDFMVREKIMHFDHERIPERVVHARGVGAHGYFESYEDWSDLTAAKFLRSPGTKTPVFVRFSTVLGSRGSPDTVRDVHGFATRFYTNEGLFDLVGNIVAPFFIQDAIKFPDIIHAGKPQPNREMPQAGTAHETAYDFFSSEPESTHCVMWALSGRGIPTNFRQVEGFGVHTFRLINEEGKAVFVKFIWKPLQGLSNLIWDEAQKIAGKDIDFHRRDLYTAIDRGDYPEWELGVQIIPEENEYDFDFDLLDPTKLVPESIVPFKPLGRMTLNRNVENYFSETEQITFHPGHVVRGIGFTDDSLLQGRLFSYLDTQLNRMNSPNFMQLPINRPISPVHNNQRDGYMQSTIFKGPVAYYPNALQNNSPNVVSPSRGGYIDYPEVIKGNRSSVVRKLRGRVPAFFDFYSQAQLFWNSLTAPEQQQLVNGARFELGKSQSMLVRERMIAALNHVDHGLARRVACAIGVAPPTEVYENKGQTSVGLSIEKYPKPSTIRTRTVAILVGPGTVVSDARAMYDYLAGEGAYVDYVGWTVGGELNVTQTFLTTSSVLFDAIYVADNVNTDQFMSQRATTLFPAEEPAVFILDAYRHGKPIGASGAGVRLLRKAQIVDIPPSGVCEKEGVVVIHEDTCREDFKKAIMQQRFWSRLPMDEKINGEWVC